VLEILGGLLGGTSLFGGSFAGMALGGVVGNETHRLYGKLRNRTASPQNHDLQKALLESLLKGIAATTDANLKKIPPSEQKQVRAWLKQRMDNINWRIRNLDKLQHISPDWETLVSSSEDNTIKLWQLSTGKEICTLSGHSDLVWSVVFSRDGQTLASGSSDKTIKIWRRL